MLDSWAHRNWLSKRKQISRRKFYKDVGISYGLPWVPQRKTSKYYNDLRMNIFPFWHSERPGGFGSNKVIFFFAVRLRLSEKPWHPLWGTPNLFLQFYAVYTPGSSTTMSATSLFHDGALLQEMLTSKIVKIYFTFWRSQIRFNRHQVFCPRHCW